MRHRVRPSATPRTTRHRCLCERHVPAVQRLRGWQNGRMRSTTLAKCPNGQATLRRSATMVGSSGVGSCPKASTRDANGRKRRLVVPDSLGPQNQVLQELKPVRPSLLGQVLPSGDERTSYHIRNLSVRHSSPFAWETTRIRNAKYRHPICLRNRDRGYKYEL